MRKSKLATHIGMALFLVLALISCRKMNTGVLLWPPQGDVWNAGDLVRITDTSYIRDTYIVNLPEQRKLKDEIDKWRIRLFHRSKDAKNYAATIVELKDIYAECLYQGLPMRNEPSNLSERVYRFREGDLMKVLGREPGPVEVGNLAGYWYHTLSEGGTEGYVFDYYLNIVRVEDGKRILMSKDSG